MGYFDRVLGKRKEEKHEGQSHSEAAQPSGAPEIVHDAAPSSSFGPPSINSSSINPSSSALGSMSFPGAGGMSGGAGGEHSARLYDPYEGISQAVGTGMRKQIFKLPQQPEFLFEEEATVRRRGWGENLQFYTGLGYISGDPAVDGSLSSHRLDATRAACAQTMAYYRVQVRARASSPVGTDC
jgi:hypothetical protein